MLVGIDYQHNGAEWPTVLEAESRQAAEAQFRRENPHVVLVRSWVYPDHFSQPGSAGNLGIRRDSK